jgi:hypothetical protein
MGEKRLEGEDIDFFWQSEMMEEINKVDILYLHA